MPEDRGALQVFDEREIQTAIQKVERLEQDFDDLRRDLRALRGDGGRAVFNGDVHLNGHQIMGLKRSGTSDMAVSRDELVDFLLDNFVFEEIITTTGTSHNLANPPLSATSARVYLNGNKMQRNGTGNMGFTMNSSGGLTTVWSVRAKDELAVTYIRGTI